MKRALSALLVLAGCGGSSPPVPDGLTAGMDLSSATGLDAGSSDLAGDCVPPTSGMWVVQGDLTRVSPDPNAWDGGGYVTVVDSSGTALAISWMTVIDDQKFFFNVDGTLYEANVADIADGKLVATLDGAINVSASDPYIGEIAPNGTTGNIMVIWSAIGGYVAALAGTTGVTSKYELPALCALTDFEGTLLGDDYQLTALCGKSMDSIVNGEITGTIGTALTKLVGMQRYKGNLYVMDALGTLYDGNLKVIKNTRRCLPGDPKNSGKPIVPTSM